MNYDDYAQMVKDQEVSRRKELNTREDEVNHPPHYTNHRSGVECIQITEHMNFCIGSAMKYLWRAGSKGTPKDHLDDLSKAAWYIHREIERLTT
jgi:hypothetical protein